MKSKRQRLRASVLDCGSPLALFNGRRKRQRTAAVQNLAGVKKSADLSEHPRWLSVQLAFAAEFAPANPYPLTE